MKLGDVGRNWEGFARKDPLWAVLSHPEKQGNKWNVDEFFATGVAEIRDAMGDLDARGIKVGRDHALDFGCGAGRLTQALAEYFGHVVGVDIAPSMVEKARELNRHGSACEFVVNPSADLSIVGEQRFDFVYCSTVLQHVEPELSTGYIAEFVRVLADGGTAVFSVPDPTPHQWLKTALPEPVLKLARRLRGQTGPVMQMWGLAPGSIEGIVRGAGGVVIGRRPCSHGEGYPGWLYIAQHVTR